ncbi:DUF222 domain-containing protein [Arthrobacter sp. Sa2CUA1]|uniref:DUF222 domain-containing protein n=1 Tax=Arthrobacter gallicola TaxID=2762225 RepID=A0ABR8URM6_9MICC|nr:HNH endonuclease [Arthrobacter gallicola]MBD7995217.1 DUF222 domain-containing protein [Arthrobacter gallicola]
MPVFCADPAGLADVPEETLPEGFAGRLSLRGAGNLGYEETVTALQRLGMLVSWAQAQQARVAARLEALFARDLAEAAGKEEPALAMSLAAAEAAAVLNLPHMTALQLISESTRLCLEAPQTLARLAEGRIAIQHARIILDETQDLPTEIPGTAGNGGGGSGELAGDPGGSGADGSAGPSGSAAGSGTEPNGSAEEDTDADGHGQADGGFSGIEFGQLDLELDSPGVENNPDDPDGLTADRSGAGGSVAGGAGDGMTRGAGSEAEVLSARGEFERDLLNAAEGRTAAGFGRRARRLRESRFPDLIPVRHRQAKDKRRVSFQALPDGMSCLSAFIAAEKGQALFTALTGAAKAGKRSGDPRTMDQLRADILTALFLDNDDESPGIWPAPTSVPTPGRSPVPSAAPAAGSDPVPGPSHISGSDPAPAAGSGPAPAPSPTGAPAPARVLTPDSAPGPAPTAPRGNSSPIPGSTAADTSAPDQPGAGTGEERPEPQELARGPRAGRPGKGPRRAERHRTRARSGVRTEVMVLINADTLAGLNEDPAELNGYGPISPETGRRMILEALHWTPLSQDPATGEILAVGRRRRIPAGLKRWLQARDGTCRFPGCSVSVTHAEIDHTTPFAHYGPTDHANLEHLCPKHHRFKTLGHWKARQPEPGAIEWHSPTGRTYTTDPALSYAASCPPQKPEDTPPDDDPPPF